MKHITENNQFKKYMVLYDTPKKATPSPFKYISWLQKVVATFIF